MNAVMWKSGDLGGIEPSLSLTCINVTAWVGFLNYTPQNYIDSKKWHWMNLIMWCGVRRGMVWCEAWYGVV